MIRFFLGLIICMSAVGANDNASTGHIVALAVIGLFIMQSGARSLAKSVDKS